MHDAQIGVTVCRQEGGAAMMAEGLWQAHRPARHLLRYTRPRRHQCLGGSAYRAPGFDADDSLRRSGRARDARARRPSRSSITAAVFGSIAKWVTEIDDPARIPELVSRAFHVATSGRPGPVVIALPEDMLTEAAVTVDAPAYTPIETYPALHRWRSCKS